MNLPAVLALSFAPVEQTHAWRDAALYALALGMGSDPLDGDELPYVHEGAAGGLQAVPSQCATLAWLPFWQRDPALAINWARIVHGEMRFTLHQPLATQGQVRAQHHIVAVQDKGPGRGVVMQVDKTLHCASTGAHLASLQSVEFLRGDGGCGSHGQPPQTLPPLPADFAPDARMDIATPRSAALLYRLASGDLMPIHADPAVARQAGFERPISHGLNNLGLACRAILKRYLPGQPGRVQAMAVRFAQPGLPGDTVRVEMQRLGDVIRFRARALERGVLLLDRGECRLQGFQA